jgi:hypothetical protein
MALRLLVLAAVLLACARADDLLLRASHHQELLGAKVCRNPNLYEFELGAVGASG